MHTFLEQFPNRPEVIRWMIVEAFNGRWLTGEAQADSYKTIFGRLQRDCCERLEGAGASAALREDIRCLLGLFNEPQTREFVDTVIQQYKTERKVAKQAPVGDAPTDNQLRLLRQKGVKEVPATKREASDMISKILGRV